MATATKQAVRRAKKRTKSLVEQAKAAIENERQLAAMAIAEDKPQFKEMARKLKAIRHDLHMGRLLVSRKRYAIEVREKQLLAIPEEIKEIKTSQGEELSKVQTMEQREAAILADMEKFKQQILRDLEKNHEVHAPSVLG